MTASSVALRAARPGSGLFAATVFVSAGLVFAVQPMVAKLVLPLLGGSPSVWNTSVAFFQAALLAGYGYAHLLQRLRSLRAQAIVHALALAAAGVVLPLHIRQPLGPPSSEHPILWLLAVLAASIGAPFAVLSATAPLVQAWHARAVGAGEGREPYVLYAASNLGSLLALLAYPILVEPHLTLSAQRGGWSIAYAAFVLLIGALALMSVRRAVATPARERDGEARPATWRVRLRWTALAAIPSSLMLGVTEHITTDVASAPFLWIAPLALYLASFVIAFSARPLIPAAVTLTLQAVTATASAALIASPTTPLMAQFAAHLSGFFFTAVMCCQALVARRPPPGQLTDFYVWVAVGGVLGGAFNAFLAPVLFADVWEFPLVLVLAALARPWSERRATGKSWVLLGLVAVAALGAAVVATFRNQFPQALVGDANFVQSLLVCLLTGAAIAAVQLRGDGPFFCAALATLSICAHAVSERATTTESWRSFFGVLRISESVSYSLGGPVRILAHGTTLHGAQALNPIAACRPLVYYSPRSPIGQVFLGLQSERPALRIGAVGLGAGAVAAYVRASDRLTFFELDPLVVRVATDPRHFTYTSRCAAGPLDYVIGDARLTLAHQPKDAFDILLIDAFSSDAVPSHLLTVEAMRSYLQRLKPDGVLILHLSNRHLDLIRPAQATALAAGGTALVQQLRFFGGSDRWESDEDAVIVGRSPAAVARFARDRRWRADDAGEIRPWTDDYVNVPGALWRRLEQKRKGLY